MVKKLRDRVWWPGLEADVKETVEGCSGCLLVSRPNGRFSLIMPSHIGPIERRGGTSRPDFAERNDN